MPRTRFFTAAPNPITIFALAFAALASPQSSQAEEVIPAPGWVDDYNPLASPDAVVGGRIRIGAGPYPSSFNYYLDTNSFSAALFGSMFETLLSSHPITLATEPNLAERCVISDDKKTFTLTLDARARWSDGRPVTSADVIFTVETIVNPANLTGPHKLGLESFEKWEALDERTVRFTAKEVHWRNLLTLGGMEILPKHYFEGKDFNKMNFEFPVVSGLYALGEVREGVFVRVERRSDWWQKDFKRVQGTGNFQTMEFRFYEERETMFEAFNNGDFDLHAVYTSHIWVQKTESDVFKKNWIVKQEIHNYDPPAWQGFAMNMRRDPYKDPLVRRALAHLLNRERLNDEIMFKQYKMHTSYWEDLYDAEHPNPNPYIEFNKDKARTLLAEAGWKANPATGILEKDGKPFVVKFLTRDQSSDKFLVIYKEDLKDVGIELTIERKDGAAWTKDMDEFNFDITWAAWGGSVYKDPQYQWHSAEADRPASVNITGFKSAAVDELIERQKGIFDVGQRNEIVRQVDKLLYEETPYVLLWYSDYTRLLYWNKFGTPDTVLSRIGDERSAWGLWWSDPDAEAELEAARKSGEPLPRKEYLINFDDHFRGND